MGNTLNVSDKEQESILSNFHELSKENWEGLGEFRLLKDNQDRRVLLLQTTYTIHDPEKPRKKLQSLEKINEIQNAARLLRSSVGINKMLCFDNYSINLFIEDYDVSLDSLIESNKQMNEEEIWIIIEDILNYLYDMQNYGLYHGDLQPKYIKMGENNIVKIQSPLLYTEYRNGYNYRLANESYKSTYSPELLKYFTFREERPEIDEIKSDIFSLGMIVLCLASQINYKKFYSFDNNEILEDRIQQNLKGSVKQNGYSDKLIFLIEKCLIPNPSQRFDLNKLFQICQNQKTMSNTQFWKHNY